MPAENPRIEELRRRVQKDPASIAFAQLAEEYRRAGNYEEAIAICAAGLQTHPSYLSARVTLGRALIETNELDAAEAELRYVLQHAAENLAAIRAMAEIHHRRGELDKALVYFKSALELARHDPDLEQTVAEISRSISKAPAPAPVAPPVASPALTPEQANAEFLKNTFDLLDLEPLDLEPAVAEPVAAETSPAKAEALGHQEELEAAQPEAAFGGTGLQPCPEPEPEEPIDFEPMAMGVITNPALPGLERFLDAIHSYRQRRAV
jgi:tetratricopeptide (TPR) repeat protein